MRKLIYILIVLLFAGATLYKAQLKQTVREKEITSIHSIWESDGVPVKVTPSVRDSAYCITKISGYYDDGKIESEVTYDTYRQIAVGQQFTASVEDATLRGKVIDAARSRDINTGLYSVTLKVENGNNIAAGTIVVARVQTEKFNNILQVPSKSLSFANGKIYIWVVENGQAQRRTVKIGITCDGYIEVVSGLREGETVVTFGMSNLFEGETVRIVEGGKG